MAEPLVQAASRLAECFALLAIGYNLKQSGILRSSDGETAIKVATTLTLPSVILQALGNGPPLGASSLSLVGVATVCLGAQLAATWLYCAPRPPRERAVLSGCCSGLALRQWGYPLAALLLGGTAAAGGGAAGAAAAAAGGGAAAVAGGLLGGAAVQCVALVDLVNHVAEWVGCYLLSASAGPAFPAAFPHEDGGSYRGQWRGMRKEGLGVYTYASGARYEGEWRDNVKSGRGVYLYPTGGVYEGEWSGGTMNGLGVRTLSSGQVKAGRWRDGVLEAPLEPWQVALAAEGAAAVAAAARSVEVGGGRLVDAVQQLAAQPPLWALAAGLAANVMRAPLPTSVALLTAPLAAAHAPLMLLAAGITAPQMPQLAQLLSAANNKSNNNKSLRPLLADLSRLLGARLLVPLAVGAMLLADTALAGSSWATGRAAAAGTAAAGVAGAVGVEVAGAVAAAAAGGGVGRVGAGALLPLAATLMALLAPVSPQGLVNARRFRLNETTAAAITAASLATSVPLMLLVGATACACGLYGTAAAAAAVDARPLLALTAAAMAAVAAAVRFITRRVEEGGGETIQQPEDRRVRMVYAGSVESPAAAAGAVAAAAASEGPSGRSAEAAGAAAEASAAEASGAGGGEPGHSGGGEGGSGGDAGGGAAGPSRPGVPSALSHASAPPPLTGAASASCCARRLYGSCVAGRREVRHGGGVAMTKGHPGTCAAGGWRGVPQALRGGTAAAAAAPSTSYGRCTAVAATVAAAAASTSPLGCIVRQRSGLAMLTRRLAGLRPLARSRSVQGGAVGRGAVLRTPPLAAARF